MKSIHPLRVVIKALILFGIADLAFGFFNPPVSDWTIYNWLVPGRLRFPFPGEGVPDATTNDIDALFASHVISKGKKPDNEFRVILIGDSSVWGEHIPPEQTLSEQLNAIRIACNGKTIHVFNLGYPHPSLLKDFLILDTAKRYQPDLVIWLVTLDTFRQNGLNPFLLSNQQKTRFIIERYGIPFDLSHFQSDANLFGQTLIGQRSQLARLFQLQLYGLYWADFRLTLSDMGSLIPLKNNFQNDATFPGYQTGINLNNSMLFSWVDYIYKISGGIPTIVVNEPIFIATGQNSGVRYNSLYPRWAYDQYRGIMNLNAVRHGWNYVDLWNSIPSTEFLNTPLHLTPTGEQQLADSLMPTIQKYCDP